MSLQSSIEWTDSTWNPVTGCTKVSPGCAHCLHPSSRVLMADWTTKAIKDIVPGDTVVAFNEGSEGVGLNKFYETAIVQKVWWTRKPAVQIRTEDDGTIIASVDHLFLKPPRGWFRAGNARVLKTRLRRIATVNESAQMGDDYCAGYIVGATEGDGTMSEPATDKGYREKQWYWRVAVTAKQVEFIERLIQCAARFGVVLSTRPFDSGGTSEMVKVETRRKEEIVSLSRLWERSGPEFSKGYLAGIFDAEGSFGKSNGRRPTSLRIANTNPQILDDIVAHGNKLGFDMRIENFRGGHTKCVRLYGSLDDIGRFFGETTPALSYKKRGAFGSLIKGTKPKVIAVDYVGETDLVDIQTTKRTFIANGFLTHNCYAETFAERFRGVPGHPYEQGFDLKLWPERLEMPLRWKEPKMIFVNSMSDLFHEKVPDEYIRQVFDVMIKANHHIFQVLTKRSERMMEWTRENYRFVNRKMNGHPMLPKHIWLGVSVENQKYTSRIKHLQQVPARVRFLSIEPLLGPVELNASMLRGIHWVIVGGESGHKARPMNPQWAIDIQRSCSENGVPFFFKQWGAHNADGERVGKKAAGRTLKGRTWNEMPATFPI